MMCCNDIHIMDCHCERATTIQTKFLKNLDKFRRKIETKSVELYRKHIIFSEIMKKHFTMAQLKCICHIYGSRINLDMSSDKMEITCLLFNEIEANSLVVIESYYYDFRVPNLTHLLRKYDELTFEVIRQDNEQRRRDLFMNRYLPRRYNTFISNNPTPHDPEMITKTFITLTDDNEETCKLMSKEITCAICLDDVIGKEKRCITNCNHTYHDDCLVENIKI